MSSEFSWIKFQIILVDEFQYEPPLVKELIFFPFLHEKMLLAERSKKRCVEIEKKIRAAGCCCMDQSYFRFLFRLARKSKQSGLSKSEKSLAKRNVTKNFKKIRKLRTRSISIDLNLSSRLIDNAWSTKCEYCYM